LCTSKPAHRSSMTCIATSAPRENGWRGDLNRQILTYVHHGNSWRCLQGLRVRLVDRLRGTMGSNDLGASRMAGVIPHVHAWW
jgi:hypothetical protein